MRNLSAWKDVSLSVAKLSQEIKFFRSDPVEPLASTFRFSFFFVICLSDSWMPYTWHSFVLCQIVARCRAFNSSGVGTIFCNMWCCYGEVWSLPPIFRNVYCQSTAIKWDKFLHEMLIKRIFIWLSVSPFRQLNWQLSLYAATGTEFYSITPPWSTFWFYLHL